MPAASSANPLKTVLDVRRSTDVAVAASWENRRMGPPHRQTERARRTEAVIEMLRRRAELRRARGQTVPAVLREAVDDDNKRRPPEAPAIRAGRP